MRIAIVDYENHNTDEIKKAINRAVAEKIEGLVPEYAVFGRDVAKRPFLFAEIKSSKPDILLTFNLAGFELCTLTDGLSYNLLSCMQLHWIDRISCENEKYLNKILSIAMFFATDNEKVKKYISENYSNVSEMYLESSDNEKNKKMAAALVRVVKETHLI